MGDFDAKRIREDVCRGLVFDSLSYEGCLDVAEGALADPVAVSRSSAYCPSTSETRDDVISCLQAFAEKWSGRRPRRTLYGAHHLPDASSAAARARGEIASSARAAGEEPTTKDYKWKLGFGAEGGFGKAVANNGSLELKGPIWQSNTFAQKGGKKGTVVSLRNLYLWLDVDEGIYYPDGMITVGRVDPSAGLQMKYLYATLLHRFGGFDLSIDGGFFDPRPHSQFIGLDRYYEPDFADPQSPNGGICGANVTGALLFREGEVDKGWALRLSLAGGFEGNPVLTGENAPYVFDEKKDKGRWVLGGILKLDYDVGSNMRLDTDKDGELKEPELVVDGGDTVQKVVAQVYAMNAFQRQKSDGTSTPSGYMVGANAGILLNLYHRQILLGLEGHGNYGKQSSFGVGSILYGFVNRNADAKWYEKWWFDLMFGYGQTIDSVAAGMECEGTACRGGTILNRGAAGSGSLDENLYSSGAGVAARAHWGPIEGVEWFLKTSADFGGVDTAAGIHGTELGLMTGFQLEYSLLLLTTNIRSE